jgi:glycosyltransferase involved in cell wall biosynthesis
VYKRQTLTDTAAHRQVFQTMLGRSLPRCHVLPVGARDVTPLPPPSGPVVVQYAGTYIPFHGVDVMLQAARLLPDVIFEFIGKGQTQAAARRDAPANVRFISGYFPPAQLNAMQAASTIMLGVFGDTAKTRYVIPNKIYEALALGRPVITAESPALAEYLTPGEHLVTVPPGDPPALAAALDGLLANPAEQARLRAAGRQRIEAGLLPQHIGARLRTIIEGLIR